MLAVILVLVIGVSFSVYALTLSPRPHTGPRGPPEYDCAIGTPPSECAQLKITCGNGVVDPYETCNNCAFDAGCAAGTVCFRANGSHIYTCNYPAGRCITGPAG